MTASRPTTSSLAFSCSVCESFSKCFFYLWIKPIFVCLILVLIGIAKTYKYLSYGRETARRLLRFRLTSSFIHKSHNITFLSHCRGSEQWLNYSEVFRGPKFKAMTARRTRCWRCQGGICGEAVPSSLLWRVWQCPSPEMLSNCAFLNVLVRCVRFFVIFYDWNLWKYA